MTSPSLIAYSGHPEARWLAEGSAFRFFRCLTVVIPRSAARFLRACFLRATRNPSGKQTGEAIRPSASQDDEAALWVAAKAATSSPPRQIVYSRWPLA